jgi:hypothetical protein
MHAHKLILAYLHAVEWEASSAENHKDAPEIRNNAVKSLTFDTDLIERYPLENIVLKQITFELRVCMPSYCMRIGPKSSL